MNTQHIHSMIFREQRLLDMILSGAGHCLDYGFGPAARNNTFCLEDSISNESIADQRARNNMSIAPASDPSFDNEAMNLGMKSNHPSSLCNYILRYSLVLLNGLILKVLIPISSLLIKWTSFAKSNQQAWCASAIFNLDKNIKSNDIHNISQNHSASMHLELQQPEELAISSSSIQDRNLSSLARNISFIPNSFKAYSIMSSDNHYSNYIHARISTIASAFLHSVSLTFSRQSISNNRIAAIEIIPFAIIYPAVNIHRSIHKKFVQSLSLEQIRFHFSCSSFTSAVHLLHFQSKNISV